MSLSGNTGKLRLISQVYLKPLIPIGRLWHPGACTEVEPGIFRTIDWNLRGRCYGIVSYLAVFHPQRRPTRT